MLFRSTIAGRTYGWAKNARIYAHKIAVGGSTGTPASECISLNDSFDLIKLWHRNKPIDPETGYKRPTVVNMSWGYGYSTGSTPTGGSYRGTTWSYGDSGYASDSQIDS